MTAAPAEIRYCEACDGPEDATYGDCGKIVVVTLEFGSRKYEIHDNDECRSELVESLFVARCEDAWDREMNLIDGVGFADPGGNSALRAATPDNPRNLPCPNCGEPNRLTPLDRQAGYQCDECADRAERGW